MVHVLLLDAGWHWANLCPFPHLTPREPELLTSTNGFPVRADSLRVFVFVFSSRRLLAAFSPLKIAQLLPHLFYDKRRLREARCSAQCHRLGMATGNSNPDSVSQAFTLLPLNVSIPNSPCPGMPVLISLG